MTPLRKMWSEEEVRQMVRDELTSPFVMQRIREAARAEVYEARDLWAGPVERVTMSTPWWRRWRVLFRRDRL